MGTGAACCLQPRPDRHLGAPRYIEEISHVACQYGIVKIVPPKSWRLKTLKKRLEPSFDMIPGQVSSFNTKRLSVAKRCVVPTKKAGESGIIFTLKVENDYHSFDLAGFEAMRDPRKRKGVFDRAADDAAKEAAFWGEFECVQGTSCKRRHLNHSECLIKQTTSSTMRQSACSMHQTYRDQPRRSPAAPGTSRPSLTSRFSGSRRVKLTALYHTSEVDRPVPLLLSASP